MSPLELKILLHYYTYIADDYHESDARNQALERFVEHELLCKLPSGLHTLTEKGRFLVEHILETPFPETNYSIKR